MTSAYDCGREEKRREEKRREEKRREEKEGQGVSLLLRAQTIA